MLRAVVDTNLLVSYVLTRSPLLSRLIDHWEQGRFVYLTSPQIIAELKDVLQRPALRARMAADPAPLIALVEQDTEQTPGMLSLTGICRDPKDDIFIACAVEGQADYIVSNDRDLLDLASYGGISIIRPETFVAQLDQLGTTPAAGEP
jgi:uncharacterized protein